MNPFQTESMQLHDPVSEGKNLLRASLFTLLVVSTDVDKAGHNQQLVQMISRKFPCKILFIAINNFHPENTLHINRSVMTTCNGCGTISCDLLTIEASSDQVHKLPFLIIPELLADLPTFLLCSEPPFALPTAFHMLNRYIHRTIFDVNDISNYSSFFKSLAEYVKTSPVIDLNWTRLEPWRTTLYRLFQHEDKWRNLYQLNKIDIRYIRRTPKHGTSAERQAMLLQAWLACRLGWEVDSCDFKEDRIAISYKNKEHHSFTLQLLPAESHFLEEGMVESIEMETSDELHYLITYELDDKHIVIHSSSKDRCSIPYSFFVGNLSRGGALPLELFQPCQSAHYLPTIEFLAQSCQNKSKRKNL